MAEQTNKESIFREKSIERLESPEKLNDYLRVTSAGIWLVLSAVVVLLIGVCIWGVFGKIEATAPAAVVTTKGESICLVPLSALQGVIEHRTVSVNGEERELIVSAAEPEVVAENTDVYTILAGNLSVGDIVYPMALKEPLPSEGVVSGSLVTETLTPASLFFDK